MQLFFIFLGALFSSFTLLCIIAFLQLNIYALLFNSNPTLAGVVMDKTKITNYLKTTTISPHVIVSAADQHAVLLSVASVTTGTTNFYGKYILELIPSFLHLPIRKPESNLLLIDNTVVVTTLAPDEVENVSPYLAYLFLRNFFQNRVIKHYPTVSLYSKQEYIAKRQKDLNQTVAAMEQQLSQTQQTMRSLSSQLIDDTATIASFSAARTQMSRQKATDVLACKTKSSNDDCQGVSAQWNGQIDTQTRLVDTAQYKYDQKQKKLTDYTSLRDFLIARIPVVIASQDNLPFEAGVFTPKDSIRLSFTQADPHGVADFLETLTHEYLHYASYISGDKKFADLFFEEGLTEYFARRTIQKNLGISTNVAYPVFVKIIEGMTQLLTESELSDLYFAKDQAGLEAALDRVYGDNFYSKNRIRFATLQYASSPKEAVKVANEILQQIGGKKITEKDLQSTSSSY